MYQLLSNAPSRSSLPPKPTTEQSMLKFFEDLFDFVASILNVLDRNGDL